jgi:hypothetical protein
MSAFALARYWREVPVYEALLAQDGIHLPKANDPHEPPPPEPIDATALAVDASS